MTRPTILVVEDNPLTRKMLRLTLESDGYVVIEAASGQAALAAIERGMPALVLQDLVLPDMSGFELVRRMRATPGGALVPVLALSGFSGRMDEAAAVGFTALLQKPIEPTRLLEKLKAYLPGQPVAGAAAPSGSGRLLLLVDDDPVQLEVTSRKLEQAGFEVLTATSGAEALRRAREDGPEVILCAALISAPDGFQTCYELRRDARLARVPVVLAASWQPTAAERELARRAGASALIPPRLDTGQLVDALLAALDGGVPAGFAEPGPDDKLALASLVIRQLEAQRASVAELTRSCTLQAAQLSLLGGVADALAKRGDTEAAIRDVLSATLDAAGVSRGALFLRDGLAGLALRHEVGFSPVEREGLLGFFGELTHLALVIARQAVTVVPSAAVRDDVAEAILAGANAELVEIVPLISDGRGVGAMILAARRTDVRSDASIAFARAMGNQLAQSLELAASFARLSASELRYRTVLENASDVIAILSPAGVILEANHAFEKAMGLTRERILGRHVRDFAAPGHEQVNVDAYVGSLREGAGATRVELRRADGSSVLFEFANRRIDVEGETVVLSVGRDVTEQVSSQAQLMVSDRMASVGMLAAGVAHEINNPLAATIANLDYALQEVAVLAEQGGAAAVANLAEGLRDSVEAAERVRTIVRDLKIFSRAEEDKLGPVAVERVMESSLRMAWNEIRHRARLVKDFQPVPPVEANESRLGQVFLNLIVNAVQALPEGKASSNEIRVHIHGGQAGSVVVEVEDTGPGIAPAVLQRLFTPFFTTKPAGVGTGLGLSICQRIVANLGGEISVDTQIGRGSIFRVRLPAAKARVEAPAAVAPPVAASRRGRLLIIDDEPMMANALRRMLAREHEVVTELSAQQALDRIEAGERFDVILCDLMMPVMTGSEFYDALVARQPEQARRVIFLTGGAFTIGAREFLDRVPNAHLDKPFDVSTVRALVSERLR